MIEVKLSTCTPDWPWRRQLPSGGDSWGPFRFHIDDAVNQCDAWVVFESLTEETTVACPRDRVVFVTGEPSEIARYHPQFLAQFSHVVSGIRDLRHPQVLHMQQGHPWFMERSFDQLLAMSPAAKSKEICVIASNKAFTAGHEKRLAFVDQLKRRLGDRLDVFGRGIRDFDSKWELLSEYRYAVVIENAQEPDFITEKLPDAWLAHCFPFYVGCTNVERYFGRGAYEVLDIDAPDLSAAKIVKALDDPFHYAGALPALIETREFYLRNYQFFPNLACVLQCVMASSRRGAEPVTIFPTSRFFHQDDLAAAHAAARAERIARINPMWWWARGIRYLERKFAQGSRQ
jgi:hypothetical protein